MSCPDDFLIEYAWQSGSVPPPHYFEYTVTIKADGTARVILIPDYPQHNPEHRHAEFFVSSEDLMRLCEAVRASGLLTHHWKEEEPVSSLGSGSANLTVHFESQVRQVPHMHSMVDALRFAPLYEMIRDLAADAVTRLRGDGETDMVE